MGLLDIFSKNNTNEANFKKSKYNFASWEHRNSARFETITNTDELKENQTDLRLAITQLNINSTQQKSLIDEWCNLLPTLTSVKQIFFYSRVNQKILNAVCRMSQLETLFIKWSGNSITSFQDLKKLSLLKRLYLGSSTRLEDLSFLRTLSQLMWLEIHEQKNLNSLNGLEDLVNLQGFIMSGGYNGKQKIKSLEPITGFKQIKYLDLASTFIQTEDLSPICSMINLEYLNLPIYYNMEEYARIARCIPNCNHGLKAYRETGLKCTMCNKQKIVLPMNKRSRKLCLNCDRDKIKVLELKFEKLKLIDA